MNSSDCLLRAMRRFGFNAAAVGVAVLDVASLQARTRPIEGVRLAESPAPAIQGDSYQVGRGLLAAGDVTGAIAAFRTALVEAPQSVDALNGLAVCYDRLGRYDISRAYYDSALAIEPGSALVLNNLGYSLFLQGKLQAAIPLLQKAVASNDAAARATGQRVLNLVAAKMRNDAAQASTAVALAEVQAPRARVEMSANGEQRLVFAGPAPDAELAARLGDAAPLVMIAAPWTRRDERALEAREAARERAANAATAVMAAGTDRAAAAPPPPMPSLASLAIPSVTERLDRRFPTQAPLRDIDPRLDLRTIAARPAKDAGTAVAASVAFAPRPRSELEGRQSGATVLHGETLPAWLLASRRTLRIAATGTVAGHVPRADTGRAVFDSDDHELNIFAARMRGVEPGECAPRRISDEQAVANLEALLTRLRAA